MRFTAPRECYIPRECQGMEPERPEGTDLEVYRYEARGWLSAIAFSGKAAKPVMHFKFQTAELREERIRKTIESNRVSLKMKADRAEARKSFRHGLKVGDILVSTWGYGQTQADFYEVTETTERSIVIREIAGRAVKDDRVVPVPGDYTGEPMRKNPKSEWVKLTSYSGARKWDGEPVYQTPAGFGH